MAQDNLKILLAFLVCLDRASLTVDNDAYSEGEREAGSVASPAASGIRQVRVRRSDRWTTNPFLRRSVKDLDRKAAVATGIILSLQLNMTFAEGHGAR